MSEMDVEAQKKLLRQCGWIPIGDGPLGEGGGARIFKVISQQVVGRFIEPLLCPMDRQAAEARAPGLAETIAEIAQGEVTTIAAGKVAKTEEHRTKREIEILRDVRHPNLIRLLTYDQSATPRWYVMPLMKHGTLKEAAKRFKGDFVAVVRGLFQVADALSALHSHEKEIVHRDIKPANIFLGDDGEWILGDPGVAYRDDGADETTTRPVSKDWFPRWYEDELGHTALADVYMLGAVGFYLLTDQLKPLDPSYLSRPKFDLPALYPDASGVKETYDLLCSIVKSDPDDMRIRNGTQLAAALRELLPIVENNELHQLRTKLQRKRDEPQRIFGYSASGADSIEAHGLQRAAVWIPSDCTELVVWIASKHDKSFSLEVVDLQNQQTFVTSDLLTNHVLNTVEVPASIRGSWQCLSVRKMQAAETGKITQLSVYSTTTRRVSGFLIR